MKRRNLHGFCGERVSGKAKIERFGTAKGPDGELISLLLVDVYVTDGKTTTSIDHAWIRLNKKVLARHLDIKEGDYINFTTVVDLYYHAPHYTKLKGYRLRKLRDIHVTHSFNGTGVQEFYHHMKNIGKHFAPEYEAI